MEEREETDKSELRGGFGGKFASRSSMNRDAKISERGFVARQEARTHGKKRIEGRLTGHEAGGEEGENLEDRSTGVTRGESLFMHLRDSGFTKVPPASEHEVPGESRYRSNSSLSLSRSLFLGHR